MVAEPDAEESPEKDWEAMAAQPPSGSVELEGRADRKPGTVNWAPVSYTSQASGNEPAEGTAQPVNPGQPALLANQPAIQEAVAPALPTAGAAQDQVHSVDDYVAMALAGHPKILAARNRVAAAANVIPQVRALPDPVVGNTFWSFHDQALQTAGGRIAHQFQVMQAVPWPDKLRAKAAVASREVQMAQAEVQRIEREIAEAVRLAYYEVWFGTQALDIVEQTRGLLQDLIQVAEARYQAGGPQQDVLRARLEADRLEDQIITLRKQKAQAQADLAALLQQPISSVPETQSDLGLEDVPGQLDALLALAEQCNPELRALVAEIQRDREKQRLACLQQYPDFNFGVNYAIVNDDNNVLSPVANGHDNLNFVVGVSVPIWRDKINAGVREAQQKASSTAQRLEAERDGLQGKLRRLMAQADALVEQQTIYEQRIIPRAEDTLKLAFADYRGQQSGFNALIDTYRELLMYEMQLARIQASLAGTLAQMERAVGCPSGPAL